MTRIPKPVKIVDNLQPAIIARIAELWPDYHPSRIAEHLNTRFGRTGVERLTAYHIWNIAGMIRRLDREGCGSEKS